jgi:mono/diheme cytochrome c family protein
MRIRVIVTVMAAVLAGPMSDGRAAEADPATVFKQHCAKCHGETGTADTPAGKLLKAPPLAGNAKVAGTALPDLLKAIRENEKHKAPLKKLSEAEITAGATRAKELAASE